MKSDGRVAAVFGCNDAAGLAVGGRKLVSGDGQRRITGQSGGVAIESTDVSSREIGLCGGRCRPRGGLGIERKDQTYQKQQ